MNSSQCASAVRFVCFLIPDSELSVYLVAAPSDRTSRVQLQDPIKILLAYGRCCTGQSVRKNAYLTLPYLTLRRTVRALRFKYVAYVSSASIARSSWRFTGYFIGPVNINREFRSHRNKKELRSHIQNSSSPSQPHCSDTRYVFI